MIEVLGLLHLQAPLPLSLGVLLFSAHVHSALVISSIKGRLHRRIWIDGVAGFMNALTHGLLLLCMVCCRFCALASFFAWFAVTFALLHHS